MPNTGDYVKAKDFDELKPKLSIGTVTTGAAGTNASASITGATPNFKLNLTIPRGNTGATGATGPAGPSGTFTGPLKPTTNYWVNAVNWAGGVGAPSGGTWAVFYRGVALTGQTMSAGIVAGGAIFGSSLNTQYLKNILCWRIQ